jgi:hypothetical protein
VIFPIAMMATRLHKQHRKQLCNQKQPFTEIYRELVAGTTVRYATNRLLSFGCT